MRVFSFFECAGQLEPVEVELRLLPGLPQLKVIGLPDAHLRECGLRIKAALTSQGYQWPRGHQVIVNLRPTHLKKASRGVELAIAGAFVWETSQAQCRWNSVDNEIFLYGEVGLTGEVRCPEDIETVPDGRILFLGQRKEAVAGRYFEISRLADLRDDLVIRDLKRQNQWTRPQPPELNFSPAVARMFKILALSEASALLAGPHGSGKSTFAHALHSCLADPPPDLWEASRRLYAKEGRKLLWRPFVNPHHTIPTLSMIGGGYPLFPGEIAKAHGGLLVLDELLQFHKNALEALREPVEAGELRVTRKGQTRVWPASFQLLATTNLCPCGKLSPAWRGGCSLALYKCRATWERLSGPMLDRFDILAFTHEWNSGEKSVELKAIAEELREIRSSPQPECGDVPDVLLNPETSLRRRRAMTKVAKALAALDGQNSVGSPQWMEAFRLCVEPQNQFRQLFG